MKIPLIDDERMAEFIKSLPDDFKADRSIHLFEDTWRSILLTIEMQRELLNRTRAVVAAAEHIDLAGPVNLGEAVEHDRVSIKASQLLELRLALADLRQL